ncbi:MAG: cobyrinic acid a,c-diamide synthase, partial [Ruminococcus sp.]|nr:cobyrinic acid a,c-diamide synthase [Ruminococcus sp.]
LERNASMKEEIAQAVKQGMPCMAECGGFMYLHEQMEDMGGVFRKTCGVIPGKCFRTPRLTRFGYITLTAGKPVFGRSAEEIGEIPAHEFHYFDSENCGSDFHAAKPLSKRGWDCMHSSSNLLAGYPHIYYYGNPQIPRAFLMKCLEYHNSKE